MAELPPQCAACVLQFTSIYFKLLNLLQFTSIYFISQPFFPQNGCRCMVLNGKRSPVRQLKEPNLCSCSATSFACACCHWLPWQWEDHSGQEAAWPLFVYNPWQNEIKACRSRRLGLGLSWTYHEMMFSLPFLSMRHKPISSG